jgi:AAA+ superfamily predicted ATPase
MTFEQQLDLYLRARCTLLVIVSSEEDRALSAIRATAQSYNPPRGCLMWDSAEGFQALTPGVALPSARDPLQALEQADRLEGDLLFVLKDFHDCWNVGPVRRKLRNLASRMKYCKKSLLILTPRARVPDELRDDAVILPLPPPSVVELEQVLYHLTRTPGVTVDLTPSGREKLLQAALGLSAAQAQRVFARAIVADGVLDDGDIDMVTEEKRQIIQESEALEFFPATKSIEDVGGLLSLKNWLRLRERAFTREAREYGLPAPRGIALIGIPGTGKSLVAKMIAGLWRLPLFRLDAGALFGSLVGESEERTRRALRLAEATAPSLLWIDEVEKALSHGGLDSGTSSRVFATVLTWMQEKTAPVFVVATANDISRLPPELLRKGRFDEIFFLDLPSQPERREILAVHLRRRKRDPETYDLKQLSEQSEGYVGAELEQAILDAMYVGFNEGREFTTQDVSHALSQQVPLSVSQRETIDALRGWLREGRAQSASIAARGDSALGVEKMPPLT